MFIESHNVHVSLSLEMYRLLLIIPYLYCIVAMKGRPKTIKLFVQNHAGLKNGSSLYKNTVLPLFQSAGINVECVGKLCIVFLDSIN